MKKAFKISLISFAAFIILLGTLAFSSEKSDKFFLIAKNLDIFATLFKEVNTYYVDDIDPTELINTGIVAMLESLDPYTDYIPEDKIEDYRFLTTGQYGGIGSIISHRDGNTIITRPYKGYPADKAGLKISDIITKIDGVEIKGKSTTDVSNLLKGQADTKVVVTIKRYNKDKEFDVEITRQKIQVNNITHYAMINDEIGYFELTGFTQNASKEVKSAMEELKKLGAKKFIFDLRRNSGGLLNEAVNVSNVFIPKDKDVVSTKGKVEEWNKNYKTTFSPFDTESPLVILTSNGTASAAEIVSGAVQDYDRGVLIGSTTFGKGLVQATRPLSYNSQLKITTAKYYIPSGRCIQAIDYSHKKDGKAEKLADSVRVAFKTSGGRTVYDGAGLKPDIEVKNPNTPEIVIALNQNNLIFDYATKYYFSHEKISEPKTFKLSDEEYKEFVSWVNAKEIKYETKAEKQLEKLVETAKAEGVSEAIDKEIALLKKAIVDHKEEDLETHKNLIKEILESEIVLRYYYEQGSIEASFDDDNDILKAIEILSNMDEYNKILGKK